MFGLSLAMVAISSRSVSESERVARPRMVWTKRPSAAGAAGSAFGPPPKPLGGGGRRIGLRTHRKASGQGILGRDERPDDLILGDVIAGDGFCHAKGKRGANRHDRKDRGKTSPSRHFRHCQFFLRARAVPINLQICRRRNRSRLYFLVSATSPV